MAAEKKAKSRPGMLWRVLRWIAILILVVIALLVVVFATTPGGRMIALTLNRLGSSPGQSVEIDRIDGLLSGSTRIGHVMLTDAAGEPWLLLKGIHIDWSPLALVSAAFEVDSLTIDRVELARLPAPGEDPAEGGAVMLPLAFDIKRFEAADIVVGEPVAGRIARFEARGSAQVDGSLSTVLADLVVQRTDGVGGELTLDADYQEAEDLFNVSAKLSEPAGGVMANLLGLSPDDAISLTATSQGSLTDWQLNANGLIDDEIVAEATVRMTAGEAGEAVSIEASGLFERFLPPSLSQIVAGRSELLLEGLIEPERTGAVIDVFTFSSARLSAQGRGRVAREGEVDLTLSVAPQPGAGDLSFGEGASRVSLAVPAADIRVTGSAEEAAVTVEVATDRVAGSGYSADAVTAVADFKQFSLATRSGAGTLSLKIGAVGSSNDIVARAVAGGVTLSGDVALGEDGAIASNRIDVKTGVAEMAVEGVSYDAAGALQARLAGTVRTAVLSDQAPGILGPDARFAGEVSLDEAGALAVRDFQLASEYATASGGVALSGAGEIAGDIEASLSRLAGVNEAVSGGLALAATVSGRSAAPAFEARITGQSLSVEGRDLSDLVLEASGVADPAAPQANIGLTGTLEGRPIKGSVVVAQADGAVRIDPLRLEVADNLISGTLVLDEAYRPTGAIELDIKDLGSLSALALQTVKGSGGGTIKFEVVDGRSVADIALGFPEITDAGFSLRDARLTATIADLLGTPKPEGKLDVAALSAGTTDVSGLAATFSQAQGWTVIEGKAQAAGFPVVIEARVRQGDAGIELEVETGRTSYEGLAIVLTEPARVVVKDGTARIEQLTISPGGGTVAVSGTAGEALNIDLAISNLPLTAVNALAPGAGLSGSVSGQVRVRGTGSAPVVSYDLNASAVRAAAASAVADVPLSITATGGLTGGRLRFDARANGGGLAFTAAGGLDTGGARSISATVNGTAPFSLLSAPLARQGLGLTGAAQIDMDIGGTLGGVRISGTVRTSDARLVDARSGIAITGLSAEIGLSPDQANIRSLSGELSSGGRITGSGTVGLDASASFPADLQLKVERGRYADGKTVATRFDADLALTGPLTNAPKLSGTVALDETTITVPDTLPSSISQLNVTHENASAQVRSQAERLSGGSAGGSSAGLALDVEVRAGRLFVRGRGMDVELGGSVRLTGTTGAPVAAGGFDLRRGRLSILGQRLNFDSGSLGFAGSVVPILNLAATSRSGSTTVTVRVTGPADSPDFSFSSSPELPEDEVLAQLVFGRSMSSLSPLQIAQLAEAVGQLTGAVKGGGLVEQLRRATGVDDIDVRTDEETGDTSLGVGKYLNDRTYLGLESGGSAGDGKARIDLDIGKGIKLRGEAGSSGETKGGIFFEREY
ncbi:hypothetical protein LL06_00620 [Hoeflea sp. BAL378]|uniref:translocation/assembly module TamB domain-containing protein n=1 Tax=Hoeflea sp. BAL378 TaxID=1547437 RepID=UPI0005138855|nr:translocation/assembly module TamB domain-containing protein [Hoeflea sp. BAL378]KGF71329.1 hypothetical protein LL06_00620 [Hoeflea sp. BAL378]